MHPCIGYSNERIEIFIARGLKHVGHAWDEGEFLEILTLSLAEAREAVFDGRITDAKTITALYWAERELREG
jgi:ADP-ribose pyrophosphatase